MVTIWIGEGGKVAIAAAAMVVRYKVPPSIAMLVTLS